jgi:dTDP-D-glucose 4,6-dehydratase
VATGRRVTLNETFGLLQPLTSYSGAPAYGAERGGDIKHSLADISLAEQHLGYKPKVNFEEGLRRTVDWYRNPRWRVSGFRAPKAQHHLWFDSQVLKNRLEGGTARLRSS